MNRCILLVTIFGVLVGCRGKQEVVDPTQSLGLQNVTIVRDASGLRTLHGELLNTGHFPSGPVEIELSTYDGQGNALGGSIKRFSTIEPGKGVPFEVPLVEEVQGFRLARVHKKQE